MYVYTYTGRTSVDDGWRRGHASLLATQRASSNAKECTEQEGTEATEGPHPSTPARNPEWTVKPSRSREHRAAQSREAAGHTKERAPGKLEQRAQQESNCTLKTAPPWPTHISHPVSPSSECATRRRGRPRSQTRRDMANPTYGYGALNARMWAHIKTCRAKQSTRAKRRGALD